MITIYTDGFSSPKKKDKAGTCFVFEQNGTVVNMLSHKDPIATNNEMELDAIREACEHLKLNPNGLKEKVMIYSDSLLAVSLINRVYKTKKETLSIFVERAKRALLLAEARGYKITLQWVPRKDNKAGKVIEELVR